MGEINNFPGASVPFGMVQYSPDTVDNYAGYDYDNPHSTGFSMTHASVGCPAFGDISMLPTTTPLGSQPWSAWEEIAHDDTEVGVPGYYTVRFPGTGVIAELTATTRTASAGFATPAMGGRRCFTCAPAHRWRQLRRDTADRGQHHNHRLGDQRRVLRQEEPVHGVLRHEVQPAVQLVWHLGRLRGLSRFTQHEFELQRGVCRVSGRLGARGADRPVLCERGRGASQPGRRRRSKLRRHPCGDIERMERRAIANRGGRQGAWRRGHLLHLSLPVTVAPQHL